MEHFGRKLDKKKQISVTFLGLHITMRRLVCVTHWLSPRKPVMTSKVKKIVKLFSVNFWQRIPEFGDIKLLVCVRRQRKHRARPPFSYESLFLLRSHFLIHIFWRFSIFPPSPLHVIRSKPNLEENKFLSTLNKVTVLLRPKTFCQQSAPFNEHLNPVQFLSLFEVIL